MLILVSSEEVAKHQGFWMRLLARAVPIPLEAVSAKVRVVQAK